MCSDVQRCALRVCRTRHIGDAIDHATREESLENRADLGLVAYPRTRKGIEIEPAWSDRLVVICPPGHKLANRKSLALKNLDGERFISFEPDLPTRQAIDAMFLDAGISVKEVVEFDNIETVKRGVEIESAISIVPSESVKNEIEAGVLKQVKLEGRNAEVMMRLLGLLEDHDDVQNVWANFDIADELLEELVG